jgi:hypothetical protein
MLTLIAASIASRAMVSIGQRYTAVDAV